MNPSEFPNLVNYRAVYRFFRKHLDMHFSDVRTLMKLPRSTQGLPGGCNFVAAAALANLVGGFAEVLYAAPPSMNGPRQSGERLQAILRELYPWQPGERRTAKANVLYYFVRNPLVHNLGIDDPRRPKKDMRRIPIRKRRLADRELVELEYRSHSSCLGRVSRFHLLRCLTERPELCAMHKLLSRTVGSDGTEDGLTRACSGRRRHRWR